MNMAYHPIMAAAPGIIMACNRSTLANRPKIYKTRKELASPGIFNVYNESAKMINAKAQIFKENQKNFVKHSIIIKYIKIMIIKIF